MFVGSHMKVTKSKVGPTMGMESSFKYFIDDADGKQTGDTDCFQTVMKIAEMRGDVAKSPDGKLWRSHDKKEFKTKKALFEHYQKGDWKKLYQIYLKTRVGSVGSYTEFGDKKKKKDES